MAYGFRTAAMYRPAPCLMLRRPRRADRDNPDSALQDLNKGVVHVNTHLADKYRVMKP